LFAALVRAEAGDAQMIDSTTAKAHRSAESSHQRSSG
jgi:hypothetical protein